MNTRLLSLDNSCQCEERNPMKPLLRYYSLAAGKMSYLRSPFLLAVRLYWGWQFVQTGWGKMHHIGKIAAFFCLGVLLLVVSFMYQRLKKIIIEDEEKKTV